MAKRKISRDEYDIRTLFFYQEKGGVYNEIITLLTRLRSIQKFRGIPGTAAILNEASYWMDKLIEVASDWPCILGTIHDPLTLCVLEALAYDQKRTDIGDAIDFSLMEEPLFHPEFLEILYDSSIHILSPEERERINAEEAELAEFDYLRDQLYTAEQALASKSEEITAIKQELHEKNTLLATLEDDAETEPTLDDVLTLKNTYEYIRSRQHYTQCNQLIGMIKDLMLSNRNLVREEDWKEIMDLEYQMLNRQNDQVVMNVNYNFGGQIVQGVIESPEIQTLLNNPNMPVGKGPKEIVEEMLKLYLNNGERS